LVAISHSGNFTSISHNISLIVLFGIVATNPIPKVETFVLRISDCFFGFALAADAVVGKETDVPDADKAGKAI
tara:strand:- start:63 stop:281 length:219 start_codon:yes stop_codon:yes gene_type:complete